jgi:oligopeptide/dipeptide ABC transporter ATP-binding protein
MLEGRNISRHYEAREGVSLGRSRATIYAVDDVTLTLREGEIFGLIGESGCGKSTLARVFGLLESPTSGDLLYDGRPVRSMGRRERRRLHRNVQVVLQDPYDSLDPRASILDIVAEPLDIHRLAKSRHDRRRQVEEMIETVGLRGGDALLRAKPRGLSGGERQRIAIARAMVLRPRYIVADEPLSMVDVSARAEIMNVILRLRREFNTGFLYITHDLSAAQHLCDEIAVMYLGRIAEVGPTDEVLRSPAHPYTNLLESAIPDADPTRTRPRVANTGETPEPRNLEHVCAFAPRCELATDECVQTRPELTQDGSRSVACFHPLNTKDLAATEMGGRRG